MNFQTDLFQNFLTAGLPSLSGGLGLQGFNGDLNKIVQSIVENTMSPGNKSTVSDPLGNALGLNKMMVQKEPRQGGGGGGGSYVPPTTFVPPELGNYAGSDFYDYWINVALPAFQAIQAQYAAGDERQAARHAARNAARDFWRENRTEVPPQQGNRRPERRQGGGEGEGTEDTTGQIPPEADQSLQMVYDILMGGGGMADYTSAFAPLRTSMEEQVQRGAADVLEQFRNFGSGSIEGVSEYVRRGEQDINSILGQLAYGADEAQRARMLQGALNLSQQAYGAQEGAANRNLQTLMALLSAQTAGTGQLGQLGMFMQGVDQQALDRAYQEWLRQQAGWSDEMFSFLGMPASYSQPYYQSGWFDQFAPLFTALLTSGAVGGGGGSFLTSGYNYPNIMTGG